ncbi:MAG: helix-turn-helix domain-containing protein [Dongiaceae bacterium]
MKPGKRHLSENCQAVSEVLQRVGDKWTVLVVKILGQGPMRFNELKRAVGGISQRMLTLTLRALERDGLVTRTVFPSVPPRVEYALTELGRSLLQPVSALAMWAIDHRGSIDGARKRFDARESAHETAKAPRPRAAE